MYPYIYVYSICIGFYLSDTVNTASIWEGRAAWGKFPGRKGYLSSVLKEVMELAWCRPGAMGHPRGEASRDRNLGSGSGAGAT